LPGGGIPTEDAAVEAGEEIQGCSGDDAAVVEAKGGEGERWSSGLPGAETGAEVGFGGEGGAVDFGVFFEDLVHVPSVAGPAEGVVAEAGGHAAGAGFLEEPAEEAPPVLGEEGGLAFVGEAVGAAAFVAVGVVDLEGGDAAVLELVELPGEALFGEGIAALPVEGDFAVAGRGIAEAGLDVEEGIAGGEADAVSGLEARVGQ
jgi:hypothetical protein